MSATADRIAWLVAQDGPTFGPLAAMYVAEAITYEIPAADLAAALSDLTGETLTAADVADFGDDVAIWEDARYLAAWLRLYGLIEDRAAAILAEVGR